MSDNGVDFDVIVIGSGFGGSVAALRATEKGYDHGVLRLPRQGGAHGRVVLRRLPLNPRPGSRGR
jgi:phytoene dehydrogenase-like protein